MTRHRLEEPLPHRTRAWLFGVAVPTAVYLAGAGLVAVLWPRLADQVVVHLGPGGGRLGSPVEFVGVTGVIAAVALLLTVALALTIGRSALARRMVLGIGTGGAVFLVGLVLAFLLPPAGWAVASFDVSMTVVTVLAVGAGAGAAAGAGTDPVVAATTPVTGPRIPAERWERRVRMPRAQRFRLAVLASVLVLVGLWIGFSSRSWYLGALMLAPVGLLVPHALDWTVTVDRSGLTAAARWGRPRRRLRAAEVIGADVVEVEPLAQFGGSGLRVAADGRGTVGVVLRAGEAIAVERTGGRRDVITVDDAATGAGVLNHVAHLARSASTT